MHESDSYKLLQGLAWFGAGLVVAFAGLIAWAFLWPGA